MKPEKSRSQGPLGWVAFLLIFAGCNGASKEQELQQEKILLELGKANTERLGELNAKKRTSSR